MTEMFNDLASIVFIAGISCLFADVAMAMMVETGNDPFQVFAPEVAAERIPLDELPEGCHYHLGSAEPHCAADTESLEVKW